MKAICNILPGQETADNVASVLDGYLDDCTDTTAAMIKLLQLNREIAKRSVAYTAEHMREKEVDDLEKSYYDYVTQLENAIKSVFSDAVVDINGYSITHK